MLIPEQRHYIDGKEILLRCAQESDAQTLIDYLKTISGQTPFLRCEPDEIHYTLEQETAFIRTYAESSTSLLLMAFVDGEFAGNASFTVHGSSRRNTHRANIGIGIFQKFTHRGLGTLLMGRLIEVARQTGFQQCELSVVSSNTHAIHLYETLGFTTCGRIPNANKYEDGSYSDDIHMVLSLND